jgi:hypothetical protein
MKPSGVVMVHNGAPDIVDCLRSLVPHVDDLILIDVESTDRTVELARPFVTMILTHRLVRNFDSVRENATRACVPEGSLAEQADERIPLSGSQPSRETSSDKSESGRRLGIWISHFRSITMFYSPILAHDHRVNTLSCLQRLLPRPNGDALNATIRTLYETHLLIAAGLAGWWAMAMPAPIKTRPSNVNSRQTAGHLVNVITIPPGLSQRDLRPASAYGPLPAFGWVTLATLQVCRQRCLDVGIALGKVKQFDFGNTCLVQGLTREVAS